MIAAAVNKLILVTEFTDPSLAFLKSYKYNLGTDDLVPFGAKESVFSRLTYSYSNSFHFRSLDAGKSHFTRYSNLVSHKQLPFVRASSSERVVLSATNWTAGMFVIKPYGDGSDIYEGFSIASHHVYKPSLSVILSEEVFRAKFRLTTFIYLCVSSTTHSMTISAPMQADQMFRPQPGCRHTDHL